MSTSITTAPLEYLSQGAAFQFAVPPSSFLGTMVKFGRNADGQTVFEYVDPDKVWTQNAYQKKANGSYQLDSSGNLIPIYNSDGTPKVEAQTLSDGTPITNKVWMDKVEHFAISPDGRSLKSNLGANQRSVSGYTSDSNWTISGSGNNEQITGKFANDWASGVYSSPLFGVADVASAPGVTDLKAAYQKYLNTFSSLAKGASQRITSKTITDEGILGDIKQAFVDLGPLATVATAVLAPEFLPLASGINTLAKGGSVEDALKSAGKSYVVGQLGKATGVLGDQAATAAEYGTDLGSQQTAMLAAQEAGLGSATDVLGNIAGQTTVGVVAGQPLEQALTNSLVSQGINTAAGTLTTPEATQEPTLNEQTDGFQDVYGGNLSTEDIAAAFNDNNPLIDTTVNLEGGDLGMTEQQAQDQYYQDIGLNPETVTDTPAVSTTGDTPEVPVETTTPTSTLTQQQLAALLKTGLGLFGGLTAASKLASGLTGGTVSSTLAGATPVAAPAVTPFTGTYSGMNPYDAAYFQQVQQNYNRLFPTAPTNVAGPLESWYQTKFVPDTTISKKLFGV